MNLEDLKKLLAAATPGPWKVSSTRSAADHPAHIVSEQDYIADCEWFIKEQNANAALIVAAVNALPELLERVKRLEEALRRLLLEFDFLIEGGHLPDIRDDIIFEQARAALDQETGQ